MKVAAQLFKIIIEVFMKYSYKATSLLFLTGGFHSLTVATEAGVDDSKINFLPTCI